jgi:hypothetical protein
MTWEFDNRNSISLTTSVFSRKLHSIMIANGELNNLGLFTVTIYYYLVLKVFDGT